MVFVTPMLLALMFGSVELGNLFMSQHTLEKQVRDGARFASRLAIAKAYSCPGTVFADANANDEIINVTKTGAVSGTGFARWGTSYWSRTCDDAAPVVAVSVSCVAKDSIDTGNTGSTGIYTSLGGSDIPVVTVAGSVKYRSVLGTLGFNALDVCMKAQSQAAVQGL
jgi:Flp pilus assembly protein TadG